MSFTHIIHLADIHIRTDRTDEYLQAFDNLCESIKEHTQNPLIVICGDTIHDRTRITPEVIKKTYYLLDNLAKLGQVILINGNHDFIENNTLRDKFLDVIPKNDNIHYITKSGTYEHNNINITVPALDDKTPPKPYIVSQTDNKLNILLGHYTIKEASPNHMATYSVKDHAGYDFALLGDIHKRSSYGNCYYSGSLIQQNHGEENWQHKGYGLIDVHTKTYSNINIHNDYEFITLHQQDYLQYVFPKYSRIRIYRHKDLETTDTDCEQFIRQKTTLLSLKIITTSDVIQQQQTYTNTFDDLSIIMSITDNKEILELHKKYRVDTHYTPKNSASFYIKHLTFENIMNYKKKCSIDFNKMQGVIGIHGNNASGKSNILRTIIFALCGSISVDYSPRDDQGRKSQAQKVQFGVKYSYDTVFILNNKSNKGYTEIIFNYNDKDYKVERTLTRKHDGSVTSTVKLFIYTDMWLAITETNKKATDLTIHNMVGRSALFILMNVYNKESTSIVSSTPRERYNIITSLFDVEMFETIASKLALDIKELKQQKERYLGLLEINADINPVLLLEEEEQLNTQNCTLREMYTPDIPKVSETNINIADVDIKKLRRELKQLIIELPTHNNVEQECDINRYKEILMIYLSVKDVQPPTDVPDNVPLTGVTICNTGVTKNDIQTITNKLQSYNYNYNETMCKDELLKILHTYGETYTFIEPSHPKTEDITPFILPVLDFKFKLPYNNNNNNNTKEELLSLNLSYEALKNYPLDLKEYPDIDVDIDLPNREVLLKVLEIHKHLYSKQSKKIEQRQKLEALHYIYKTEFNKHVDTYNRIFDTYQHKYNRIIFDEVRRRISYQETRLKYNEVYNKYLQNIAYQTDLAKKYKLKMETEAQLRYMNRIIETNTKQLSIINNIVTENINNNNERLKEIKKLLDNHKQQSIVKELKDKLITKLTLLTEYNNILIKNGGVKNYILSKYLEHLTESINSNLHNYRISLELKDTDLKLLIHKDSMILQPQQLSGYEAFALELSAKYTLNKFSSVGTSKLLVLDEGFDVIDETNLELFTVFLNTHLMKHYKHILLISHNETVKSIATKSITPAMLSENIA